MKRRTLLKWTAPSVVAVTLPSHATTSEVPPVTTTGAPVTTPTPAPTLPPDYCATGEVMMCKRGTLGIYNTECVAPANVARYESLGYTVGMCPPNK